ncbi:hypothetical protein BBJ29_005873 [Phytophthora kernoviae]|uniref:Uncharacterized protein n=1 Tax=Phytophthora kernoviae TaxID=325452 RepID=A0A3F2RX50_9STRA|nr:hypothetical protein BBJ29_005873 [Phytophthora kernoviae]RLN65982.1 hypothetical protein BBP00_00002521 [Phytophthora kernoviae]
MQPNGDFGVEIFPFITLSTVSSSLTVLDLSFNELDDNFWMHWTTDLQGTIWPSLSILNLANNQFSARGLEALAAFVAQCPNLLQLDVSLNLLVSTSSENGASACSLRPLIDILDAKDRKALQVVDLSCTGLTDSCISELIRADFSKEIMKLYLRSNALTDETAIMLGNALPHMKIEVLSLAGNTLGNCGAASLAFVLDQSSTLQTLDLDENQIGQEGIASFYHAISGMAVPFPLRYLHLGRNPNGSEDILKQMHTKLHEKIIETQLCFDLYVHVVTRTLRTSSRWELLEVLDLSGNEIGEKGVYEIGLFLALQPPLRVLNMSSNLITDKAITGLADGIEPNTKLQELLLDHNQITDAGAKQLYLQAFKANQQRRIRLSVGNSLTSECKVMLAAISQAHDLRKRFAKEFAGEEKLDFSGRALRQYGASAIIEELVATPTSKCRSIDFSRNGLGDEGAQAVAQLLRSYPRLEELDVSFNDIGDEGAFMLAEALAENSTLLSFSLHSVAEGSQTKTKLSEKGLCRLAQAIQSHKTLARIDLRDNITSPTVVHGYVEMLHRNPSIQKFNGTVTAVFLARYDA